MADAPDSSEEPSDSSHSSPSSLATSGGATPSPRKYEQTLDECCRAIRHALARKDVGRDPCINTLLLRDVVQVLWDSREADELSRALRLLLLLPGAAMFGRLLDPDLPGLRPTLLRQLRLPEGDRYAAVVRLAVTLLAGALEGRDDNGEDVRYVEGYHHVTFSELMPAAVRALPALSNLTDTDSRTLKTRLLKLLKASTRDAALFASCAERCNLPKVVGDTVRQDAQLTGPALHCAAMLCDVARTCPIVCRLLIDADLISSIYRHGLCRLVGSLGDLMTLLKAVALVADEELSAHVRAAASLVQLDQLTAAMSVLQAAPLAPTPAASTVAAAAASGPSAASGSGGASASTTVAVAAEAAEATGIAAAAASLRRSQRSSAAPPPVLVATPDVAADLALNPDGIPLFAFPSAETHAHAGRARISWRSDVTKAIRDEELSTNRVKCDRLRGIAEQRSRLDEEEAMLGCLPSYSKAVAAHSAVSSMAGGWAVRGGRRGHGE